MLQARGYIVSEDDINMTTDDWRSKFGDEPSRDALMYLTEKIDDPSDQLFVFFPGDDKVGVGPIKTFVLRMKQENITRAIIVIKNDLTHFAKQAIRELASRGYKVEYFVTKMGWVFYQEKGVRNDSGGHLWAVFTPRRSFLVVGVNNGRNGIRVV